jgi:hypothetical protein
VSDWPPSKGELLETYPDSELLKYPAKIREELAASVPNFEQLGAEKKKQLCDIVRVLDLIGMTTMSRLQFPIEELAFYAPPRTIEKNKRLVNAWFADRADYEGTLAAKRARDSLMAGDFIDAISAALLAGEKSRARSAEIGSKTRSTLPRRGSVKPKDKFKLERDNWIIERARELLRKYPDTKDAPLARLIFNSRAKDAPELGEVDTVRRFLAKNRNLVRQGLPYQT